MLKVIRGKMKNKKAIIIQNVIFIMLNLMIAVSLLFFTTSSLSGKYAYEQVYAKKIALIIDAAKPNMSVAVDMKPAFKFLEKTPKLKDSAVFIDKNNKNVVVDLGSSRGYTFGYFSSLNIEYEIKENRLLILRFK